MLCLHVAFYWLVTSSCGFHHVRWMQWMVVGKSHATFTLIEWVLEIFVSSHSLQWLTCIRHGRDHLEPSSQLLLERPWVTSLHHCWLGLARSVLHVVQRWTWNPSMLFPTLFIEVDSLSDGDAFLSKVMPTEVHWKFLDTSYWSLYTMSDHTPWFVSNFIFGNLLWPLWPSPSSTSCQFYNSYPPFWNVIMLASLTLLLSHFLKDIWNGIVYSSSRSLQDPHSRVHTSLNNIEIPFLLECDVSSKPFWFSSHSCFLKKLFKFF